MTRLVISLCWQLCIHLIDVSSSLILWALNSMVPRDGFLSDIILKWFFREYLHTKIPAWNFIRFLGRSTQMYTPINNKLLRERIMHTYKHNYFLLSSWWCVEHEHDSVIQDEAKINFFLFLQTKIYTLSPRSKFRKEFFAKPLTAALEMKLPSYTRQ